MNQPRNASQRITLMAMLAASAVATNYAMIGLVNVKFMDLIVFTSGYILGSSLGAVTGVLVWLIYGVINPFGFSLPVLVATILGETLYGLVGGLFGEHSSGGAFDIWAAITGFLVTFVYDVFTNIVSGVTAGIPLNVALVTGIPFMLAHTISNTLFFGLGFKPLTNAVNRFYGEKFE